MTTSEAPAPYPAYAGDTSHRLPALDGVRGIAIIAVLVYHFFGYALADVGEAGPAIDRFVHKVTGAGWTGVDLFFVLSGFLITGILITAKQHAGSYFRGFYTRRVLRIFPANYVYLIALFLLIPLLAPDSAQAAVDTLAEDRWWYATFLTNVLVIIHGATRPDFFITGHLWSLAVEEQFYLTWPAIVLLLNRRQLMFACLAFIAFALALRVGMTLAGVDGAVSLTLTPARLDSLAIGGLIALALHSQRDFDLLSRFLPPAAIVAAIAAAGIAIANGGLHALDKPVYTVGYTLVAIAFGGFMLQAIRALPGSTTYRWLTTPALTSAGRYSYMMYLVHLPIAWLLFQRTNVAADVPTLAGSHLPGEALFAFIALVPTVVIAWISWRVLETPFLRLKERMAVTARGRDSERGSPARPPVSSSATVAEDA